MTAWEFILATVAFIAVCLGYLAYLAATAPEGFEDSEGWYPGTPDDERDQ